MHGVFDLLSSLISHIYISKTLLITLTLNEIRAKRCSSSLRAKPGVSAVRSTAMMSTEHDRRVTGPPLDRTSCRRFLRLLRHPEFKEANTPGLCIPHTKCV